MSTIEQIIGITQPAPITALQLVAVTNRQRPNDQPLIGQCMKRDNTYYTIRLADNTRFRDELGAITVRPVTKAEHLEFLRMRETGEKVRK